MSNDNPFEALSREVERQLRAVDNHAITTRSQIDHLRQDVEQRLAALRRDVAILVLRYVLGSLVVTAGLGVLVALLVG